MYRDFGSYYEARYFQPRAFISLIIALTWLGYANQWDMITFEEEFHDDGEDDTSGGLDGNLEIHRPDDVRGTDCCQHLIWILHLNKNEPPLRIVPNAWVILFTSTHASSPPCPRFHPLLQPHRTALPGGESTNL